MARHDYVNEAVNQLSYTSLLSLLFCAVGGDGVITCRTERRDWLPTLPHVQHYANEAARVVQDLYSLVGRSVFYFILFWHKVAKFLHNSCARVLFYFILFQMGEPL